MRYGVVMILLAAVGWGALAADDGAVQVWLSDTAGAHKLSELDPIPFGGKPAAEATAIDVDPAKTYQSIVGIGSSLEHATAYNLSLLSPEKRAEVITRLVDPDKGIGMNLMRICIGTSDFAGEPWYTYDDMPAGETDWDLKHFSIDKDRAYLLPVLKRAKQTNPDLEFVASPWSPPAWMKTNHKLMAGRMNPKFYDAYARYLLKFLQAYDREGLPVYAMTLQNEPNYPDPNYPTCYWRPESQETFIRDFVGPLFAKNNVSTLIWCWDHNFNFLRFPETILKDPKAAQYVDGTAFHFYEGKPSAMTRLHNEFPDKHIYFTEGSTFGPRGALTIIDLFRNWARSYLAWVTVLDQNHKPNNGPHHASDTCIMLNTKDMSLDYRFDFYMYGQFSKFIHRGAVRVDSSEGTRHIGNVAFRNPDGSFVMVVANSDAEDQPLQVRVSGKRFSTTMPGQSVATFVWGK